jgi:hypothetical protein
VVRLTPTLLSISDATKLPLVYGRYADKSQHYITGSFGKTESVFNMQNHKQHAQFRKVIAGPVIQMRLFSLKRVLIPVQYSFSNVKRMEPLVDARINFWTSKLTEKFAKTGDAFDFAPWAV